MTVAVLFAATRGVYADLPGVEIWDEARDARRYAGPHPVVAHPPCQRWSVLAPLVESVHGYKVGDDGGCFEAALEAVRTFGGVLEHPAQSIAWPTFGLPEPQTVEGWTGGFDGGWSAYVEQGRYGLAVRKATWLYAYGVDLPALRWGRAAAGDENYVAAWRASARYLEQGKRRIGTAEAETTPVAFRDELLAIARSASSPKPLSARRDREAV